MSEEMSEYYIVLRKEKLLLPVVEHQKMKEKHGIVMVVLGK